MVLTHNCLRQLVSTHSRPKAAVLLYAPVHLAKMVSTHSRPKAAGRHRRDSAHMRDRFNTQPPEGGCLELFQIFHFLRSFNTQPPEGGC